MYERAPTQATIVSLEAEDELLIVAEDLVQARDEGVRFRPQTALVEVLADGEGNVRGAVLAGARLGRDQDGNVTPQLSEGTGTEVPCDTILVAIGQVQVLDWLPAEATERGLIRADEYGRIPHGSGRIFVGGDVMRGPSMVVDALGDGKRAARDIDRVLSAEPLRPDEPVEVMPYEKLNTAYFRHAPRPEAPLTPAGTRRTSLLYRVPRRQRAARRAAERPLLDPHALLQGLPSMRAGVPHRLPGEGPRDGLRRARRGGADGDRLRPVRGRARRAGAVHPPAHRGRDRRIRRGKIKFNSLERTWCVVTRTVLADRGVL